MAELRCPMCSTLNAETADVCSECGARLTPLVVDAPETTGADPVPQDAQSSGEAAGVGAAPRRQERCCCPVGRPHFRPAVPSCRDGCLYPLACHAATLALPRLMVQERWVRLFASSEARIELHGYGGLDLIRELLR